MLKEIKEKLREIDDNVFYGAVDKKSKRLRGTISCSTEGR